MNALDKFEAFNRKLSETIEWVGIIAIVLMMLITTVDVLGAKLFKLPIFGALDMMMILQLVAMSFAVAITLVFNRHVQVDFFVMLLPKRVQALVDCLVNLLGLFLFVLIVWQLILYGHDLQTGGEVSSTARIPFHPFTYGAALACVPVCLIYICGFLSSVKRVFYHDS